MSGASEPGGGGGSRRPRARPAPRDERPDPRHRPGGSARRGGDRLAGAGTAAEQADRNPGWSRFTITFADGGTLRLFDKRRLGRVRLDPDLTTLGPDAERISAATFHDRVGRGTAPVKARLLDQSVLAGVGNLLADETLWQARLDPRRRVDTLDDDELRTLHRALRTATRAGGPPRGGAPPARVAHPPPPGPTPPGGRPPRWRAHRRRDRPPPPRGPLPPVRRCDAAGHRGRPDHLVLPTRTGVTQGAR